MTKELKQQIDSMVEDYCSDFMDAYQCMDWGISAHEFAEILVENFKMMVADYAKDLDMEDNENED